MDTHNYIFVDEKQLFHRRKSSEEFIRFASLQITRLERHVWCVDNELVFDISTLQHRW